MKEPAELLIPQTGTFPLEQLTYIRELAAENKWSSAEAIRVLCAAGRIEYERRKKAEAAVGSGSTQIDPAYFSQPAEAEA